MTPQEKAKELVEKMYLVHSNFASEITMYFAKQCALIAVKLERDSLINACIQIEKDWSDMFDLEYFVKQVEKNYLEVKQEIEKL
jgi:hypothetical protein